MIGGSEAGNIEPLLLDASGFLKVNVAAGSSGNAAASATGSAVPADADYLGASDGTDLQGLLVESATHPNLRVALYNGAVEAAVDAQGGVKVAGEAASGSAVTGNPVLVAGQDGTDARTLLTDNTGQLKVLVENGSAIAVSGTVTAEIEGHAGATLDGAAGSPSTQCVTVQGNSSGTAIPTTDSGLGPVAPGNAAANSNLIGGIFNSTPPAPTTGQQTAIQQDSKGSAYVNTEGRKATYVVTLQAQAIASGINLTLQGSATKIIRITRLTFSGLATTAGGSIVSWGITTAAFTGGTTASANFNQGTLDSSNPAATAVPLYYTAAPTGGGAPINIETFEYPFELAASLNYVVSSTFGNRAAQCPTLRGTTQFIYLSIPTAAAGGKYTVAIEWTEE